MATFRSFTGYLLSDLGTDALAPNTGDTFDISTVTALNIVIQDDDTDTGIEGDIVNEANNDADQFVFAEQGGALVPGGLDGEQLYLEATFTFTVAGDPNPGTVYTGYSFEGDASGVDFLILPPDVPSGAVTVTGRDFNPDPNSVDYDALASGDENVSEDTPTSIDLSGDDIIIGGDGDDVLRGQGGADEIFGGDGNDLLLGGSGSTPGTGDNATTGTDTIFGGAGDDTIRGNAADDTLSGGDDNDLVGGGAGNDSVSGDGGDDALFGNAGDDTIDGGDGDDTIDGGDDNDTIDGGAGADFIRGGAGDDVIDPGADGDTVIAGDGNDTIIGGTGSGSGNDVIFGGAGNDQATGFQDANFFDGGTDDDIFTADNLTTAEDTVFGGTGNDTLSTGLGDDTLYGEDGSDILNAGSGDDLAIGGSGDDSIEGGDGNDTIFGDGDDIVRPEIFVSEVVLAGLDESNDEFLEVTVRIDQDLEDFTISGYDVPQDSADGTNPVLSAGLNSFFTDAPEVTLQQILDATGGELPTAGSPVTVASGVGGLDLEISVHPDQPDYLVFTVPMSITANLNNGALAHEVVALTNTATNEVISAIDIGSDNSLGTLSGGVADGAQPASVGLSDGSINSAGVFSGNGGTNTPGTSEFAQASTIAGNDTIIGGAGDDSIDGNGGDDSILGDTGDDSISGGAGEDIIDGGTGADSIVGGDGNDSILGDAGDDSISGGDGEDTIDGGADNDFISGGDEDDTIDGGAGDDTIGGGAGDDSIDGGTGADFIEGNAGNDIIEGNDDNDLIYGDSAVAFDPFFSGLNSSGAGEGPNGEYLEVTISTETDPADIVIGFYNAQTSGGAPNLVSEEFNGSAISSFFPDQGEFTLQDVLDLTGGALPDAGTPLVSLATSLTDANALDLEVHFQAGSGLEPDSYVFVVPFSGVRFPTSNAANSVNVVALTDTSTGNISAIEFGNADQDYAALVGGVAAGAEPVFVDLPSDTIGSSTVVVSNTGGDDVIDGGIGDDTIFGNGGDDTIDGGAGADLIDGQLGNDSIAGDGGDDTIDGGEGDDTIDGDEGDDTIVASTGTDIIDGGDGADTYTVPGASTIADDTETITVVVNNDGDGSVAKTVDATNDTVTSIETFIADEALAENDSITINDTDVDAGDGDDATGTRYDRSEISGLDDNAVGTFTLQDSTVLNFGPGTTDGAGGTPILLSEILAGSASGVFQPGTIQITSGDESGTVGNISFENFETINFGILCFGRGTLIKTIEGERPIETLSAGDRVLTMEGTYAEIRWIGSRGLDSIDLTMNPKLKPIIIRADALGAGFPEQDLIVSPQHRIFVRSIIAERMFGTPEVLIPANKLLTLDGIDIQKHTPDGVEYWHMLFDDHQIVWANGAPSESLFTGPEALKAVSSEGRFEIQTLFPEICEPDYHPIAARFIPEKGKLMKKLAQRHQANKKPLFSYH